MEHNTILSFLLLERGRYVFINLSNHPSGKWDEKQLAEAGRYGELRDMVFPGVPADSTETEVDEMADQLVEAVLQQKPDCVMCQGEFTLTYRIVERLKARGVLVVAACSERRVCEQVQADGTVEKISVFQFCRFRQY